MENVELNPTNVNRHIVADLYDIKMASHYDGVSNMTNVIHQAAKKAQMSIVGEVYKKFEPQGSSGVVLLAESHLSYHMWPEHNFISLDIFCCGEEGDPQTALDHIIEVLKPNIDKSKIIHLDRSFNIKQKQLEVN